MSDKRTKHVPIKDVLHKLGIETYRKWDDEIWLCEWKQKTSWRSANIKDNLVNDFTDKWRPKGDPYAFVKQHFNILDDKEVYERFEQNFTEYKPTEKESVYSIWKKLPELSQKQVEYLEWRGIEYNKVKHFVKDYNWAIGCMIFQNNVAVWLTARTLNTDHNKRFVALKWYKSKWVYKSKLDEKKDYVIVVEWLIDFLTVRQYEQNVVALKSLEAWYSDVKDLAKKYKIKMVFDNDEHIEKAKEKMKWISYSFFDWSEVEFLWYQCKDVNDLVKYVESDLIWLILDCQIEDSPILSTIEKFKYRQEVIKERGGMLWEPWPIPEIYNRTKWIIENKVYTIWAFSNTGKSKLAYYHAQWFLKQGKKVMYVSIEESEVDIFSNIACSYYNHWLSKQHNLQVNISDFKNLICVDYVMKLQELEDLVDSTKPDILFIDYVQGLFTGGSAYEKNAMIAMTIQKTTIRNWCTTFCLSQLSNSAMKELSDWLNKQNTISLKGAWEYYFASDVILILSRTADKNALQIKIEKNKFWVKWDICNCIVDRDKNMFNEFYVDDSYWF